MLMMSKIYDSVSDQRRSFRLPVSFQFENELIVF